MHLRDYVIMSLWLPRKTFQRCLCIRHIVDDLFLLGNALTDNLGESDWLLVLAKIILRNYLETQLLSEPRRPVNLVYV